MPRVSAAAETDSSIWRLSLFFFILLFWGGGGGVGWDHGQNWSYLKLENNNKKEKEKNPNVSLRLAKRTTSRLNKKRF